MAVSKMDTDGIFKEAQFNGIWVPNVLTHALENHPGSLLRICDPSRLCVSPMHGAESVLDKPPPQMKA